MLILLDPAHGHNTPGKRFPDGTLLEYAYTRDLANQILAALKTKGHNAQLLVPETEDIPLKERVRLATCLYQSARHTLKGKTIRTDCVRDGDSDWEENFYILRHSLCPAVLTENFFQDCLSDVQFLQSRAGKQAVVDTHVEGITEYLHLRQHSDC